MAFHFQIQRIISLTVFSMVLFSQFPLQNISIYSQPTSGALILKPVQSSETPDPLSKSWVIESLTAGQSVNREIVISNSFDVEQKLKVKGSDATQNTIGTFSVKEVGEPSDAVGNWLKVEQDSIVVPAKSEATIKYSISVPEGTKSGEYAGAVVTYNDNTGSENTPISQAGVRVYITVPGDNQSIKTVFRDPTFSKDKSSTEIINIDYLFSNTGSVYTKSKGKATLSLPDGTKVDSPIDFDTSPNTKDITRSFVFNKKLQSGKYTLEANWENSPLITSNKNDTNKDSSSNKSLKNEFNVDSDVVTTIANRGNSNPLKVEDNKTKTDTNPLNDNNKRILITLAFALVGAGIITAILYFVRGKKKSSQPDHLQRLESLKMKSGKSSKGNPQPSDVATPNNNSTTQQSVANSQSENIVDDVLDNDYV